MTHQETAELIFLALFAVALLVPAFWTTKAPRHSNLHLLESESFADYFKRMTHEDK